MAGNSTFHYGTRSSIYPSAVLGLSCRFYMKNSWYLEPYIRGGYPVFAGAGLLLGRRFGQPDPVPDYPGPQALTGGEVPVRTAPDSASPGVKIPVAVFPVGEEGMAVANDAYGGAVFATLQELPDFAPARWNDFPPEFLADEPPAPANTGGARYALTAALYAPTGEGDQYHLQMWLWDVETPALVYTDELVCDTVEDGQEFLTLMAEWVFSHVPRRAGEPEPNVETVDAGISGPAPSSP
jgi:hypothetical protein